MIWGTGDQSDFFQGNQEPGTRREGLRSARRGFFFVSVNMMTREKISNATVISYKDWIPA